MVARVAAQLIQAVTEVSWLPAFSAWQSGALPYPALLVSQLLIIAVQVELIRRSVKGRFAPSRTLQVGERSERAFLVQRKSTETGKEQVAILTTEELLPSRTGEP